MTEPQQHVMTKDDIDVVKKSLGGITEFLAEHAEPATEERKRIIEAMASLEKRFGDIEKRAIMDADDKDDDASPYPDLDGLDYMIMRSVHGALVRENGPNPALDAWSKRLNEFKDVVTRDLSAGGTGTGAEYTFTDLSSSVWRDLHMATRVGGLFSRFDMPTDPFEIPVELGDATWYIGAENTAVTASTPTTGDRSISTTEFVTEVPWSYQLSEDSVVAMLPEVRASLTRQAAELIDDVLLNADTTTANNINWDGRNTVPAGKGYLQAWDGLIHRALIDRSQQSIALAGTLTSGNFIALLKRIGKYASDIERTPFIADVVTATAVLGLSEVITVDKFGPRATIRTGQIGSIFGHPVIMSGEMQLADSDGKVTDGGNDADKGRVLLVHTPSYRVGYRRRLLVETDKDISKRQYKMVVSLRVGFNSRVAPASDTALALAYNATV